MPAARRRGSRSSPPTRGWWWISPRTRAVDVLGVLAAVCLGAVFVIAGAAKVALGAAWPAQARAMGAPMPIATVVPAIELVVGAALVTRVAMPLPALAAIV